MKITWTTEQRKVADLKPYPGNPRKWEKEAKERLTESLERFTGNKAKKV